MDKDRMAGAAKQTKGAIKDAAGKVTGNTKLQAEGKADKTAGKVQSTVGGARAMRVITALFDNLADAERARARLVTRGIARAQISIMSQSTAAAAGTTTAEAS